MKFSVSLLQLFLIISCVNGRERTYTGSTPANSTVRFFLDIPQTDSVDFIRWKIDIGDGSYTLTANFGIGKPNTNGFMNGGKQVSFSGPCSRENNYRILVNGSKILKAIELNEYLLHLASPDGKLLSGTSGWSYTLSDAAGKMSAVNIVSKEESLNDSTKFSGRTPCGVPGISRDGECRRLKWALALYASSSLNQPTGYRIRSTLWRDPGGKTGKWRIIRGEKGQIIYELLDEQDQPFLHLLKINSDLLIFTDAKGNAPAGNEDSSYSLSRS